ncbi:MAG: galactose-1-epimerase, partial [Gemmatimonadota bacterium]|nr:galactose-1-epimerase [Gemmatimonadota bacterium]
MTKTSTTPAKPSVTSAPFGVLANGDSVHVYTLTNANGLEVRILDYGGIVQSIRTPDRDGHFADIVLGFDTLEKYVKDSPYFGAVVGRFANRIARGHFTLDGKTYTLPLNDHPGNIPCSLHGGTMGFDKQIWTAHPTSVDGNPALELTYVSKDGEMGYPGTLTEKVTYCVTADDGLRIDYQATT